ncbi:probable F420-dependent oxidoreductase, MSMEG_3544 family [Actinomadura meyerae]|uniref:Probable F420-dependent oxidoreductase, MSMEG_3544 family n=1 Tax=Actinomadura meyerae TaxID=240840 RepID=A0A239H6S6_9ACTN|nr:LLM class flavin-dependent oxidoreductase [Actinomadura meyerae]SNS76728.1 probable F420-dependent oxidoreductase, MSMEG_3544 family [Actinomadura meyerae]
MIIRIGMAPAASALTTEALSALALGLEREGFDSLWVSERVTGPALDPVVTLAYAAALTSRIKFGTAVMTLPGRSPAVLAKELASLDVLSGGRLLPAFGLGLRHAGEQQAFGVRREDRAAIFEEALPLLRRFWAEDEVSHDGPRFRYEGLRVLPKPAARGFDVWMGGTSEPELRRTGRLSDGWLAAFTTPAEGERGRRIVQEAAARAGREIEEEHFGAVVPYRRGPLPPEAEARLARVRRINGAAPLDDVVPDLDGLADHLRRLVGAGLSKFVLAPLAPPEDWDAELADVRDAALHLQTRR